MADDSQVPLLLCCISDVSRVGLRTGCRPRWFAASVASPQACGKTGKFLRFWVFLGLGVLTLMLILKTSRWL